MIYELRNEKTGGKEMERKGYIKLYRKVLDDEVFKNPLAWQLFSYCLLNAEAWENGETPLGTFETTYSQITDDIGMTRPTIIKYLNFLKNKNMIEYWNNHQKTTIQVVNFRRYNPPSK